jgi:hypothetical protein
MKDLYHVVIEDEGNEEVLRMKVMDRDVVSQNSVAVVKPPPKLGNGD